mgnify:FL=1
MKKVLKYYGITLLVISGLFIIKPTQPSRSAPYFDVVMVDNELYFVSQYKNKFKRVVVSESTSTHKDASVMWAAETSGVDVIKTRQIKYGQELKGFYSTKGPWELEKNVRYLVLDSGPSLIPGAPAVLGTIGDFIIVDGNKVIMTSRDSSGRPKNCTVIIEKNGRKITMPYSVSFDKDGNKVIVSGPGAK